MNLDNTVTAQAVSHFDHAARSLSESSRRLETGSRFANGSKDHGGLSVSMRMDFDQVKNGAQKINLQNFITLLQSQEDALQQAGTIYRRMGELATKATDSLLNESHSGGFSDKSLLNAEFVELSKELSGLIDLQINGRRLFGGVKADFTEGLQDRNDFTPENLPQVSSLDVHATQGKITLELSPGGAQDQFWVFQGEIPQALRGYFEAPADGSDADTEGLTNALYDYFDGTKDPDFQGIFTTGSWRTFRTSGHEYYDKFIVDFDSCAASLETVYHDQNTGKAGLAEDLRAELEASGKLLLNAPNGNSTFITMIGVNVGNNYTYEVSAAFEPSLPYNDIEIPGTNEVFPAISFSEVQCSDISTTENALKALGEIDAAMQNLLNSQASIAAAQNRYQFVHDQMSQAEVSLEKAHSRISDSDVAAESINFAKQMLKMNVATDVVRKSVRLSDALISLTTNHFRSRVIGNILY